MAGFIESNRFVVLGSVAIVMIGLMGSGFLLGDGLRRAKEADREVTVKGVSERDVTADIATWSISFSDTGNDLAGVQGSVDRQADAVREFFTKAGFKPVDFTDSDISLMRDRPRDAYGNPLPENLTVSRTIQLRTDDVMRARQAYAKQADLLRAGVEMGGGSVNYTFTGLNELKPEMIAEANRSARESAQQFANDSGAGVGKIKTASQGYFSIGARDGVECEYCDSSGANTPFQKVRVVTTVAYELN